MIRETMATGPMSWEAETLMANDGKIELSDECLAELRALAAELEANPLPVEALGGVPDALRRRVLRLAALAAGAPAAELFHEHVLALDSLITRWRGQKWVDLPGHLRGVRRSGLVQVVPAR